MKEPITLNVLGKHNVSNALAAIAIGLRYDVPMSAIKAQLSTFSGQRQNIIHVNDYILIDDAYNASPDSMKASLSILSEFKTRGRKIAVLSDMLELAVIVMDCSFPVARSLADTFRIPLTSISNVTSICGTPRMALLIPFNLKVPRT